MHWFACSLRKSSISTIWINFFFFNFFKILEFFLFFVFFFFLDKFLKRILAYFKKNHSFFPPSYGSLGCGQHKHCPRYRNKLLFLKLTGPLGFTVDPVPGSGFGQSTEKHFWRPMSSPPSASFFFMDLFWPYQFKAFPRRVLRACSLVVSSLLWTVWRALRVKREPVTDPGMGPRASCPWNSVGVWCWLCKC